MGEMSKPLFANGVDPDQPAFEEAVWSGSLLFVSLFIANMAFFHLKIILKNISPLSCVLIGKISLDLYWSILEQWISHKVYGHELQNLSDLSQIPICPISVTYVDNRVTQYSLIGY